MEIDTKPFQSKKSFHLAGVIPVAGQSLDFEMAWHDCMMAIGKGYTLIQNAVYECAYAGCETIWIVCNDDMQPLIRHVVGDYIYDPVYMSRKHAPRSREEKKKISIFYVPIHPKDRDKRDCLGWSVLHGAVTALKVSSQLSKWLIPDKYYVSFPYGLFPSEELRPLRDKISSTNNFYITSTKGGVGDNQHTSFTFGKDEFVKYRRNLRKKATGMYTSEVLSSAGIPTKKLPVEERYSARFFDLSDIFEHEDSDGFVYQPSFFHNVSSWEEYVKYISTTEDKKVKKPWVEIVKYKEFNPIGVDR